MPSPIPNPEIDATLDTTLDAAAGEWRRKGKTVTTTYTFATFRQTFGTS